MYHSNSALSLSHSLARITTQPTTLKLEIVLYFTQNDRERAPDFDMVGQLRADSKKVSFLKIFPPSPQSSSWSSESILVVKGIFIFYFIGAGWRFQMFVYQQKLSFRSISNIFQSKGIKRFLFWCRERRPEQASSMVHPSVIPDNSSIYNNCICWKVLLLRK